MMKVNSFDGFVQPPGKRPGGITSLWFCRSDEVVSVDCDPDGGACNSIILRGGACFRKYGLREGSGSYREDLVVEGGMAKIVHKLSFDLSRLNPASASALTWLIDASRVGVVALIETQCGDLLFSGWSADFGSERPLTISASVSSTGKDATDQSMRSVTLQSEDTSPSLAYTGDVSCL